MGAPLPPSPPAARPSISKASALRSTASTRSRRLDIGAVEAAIGDQTAGILIEPIMGEGGMREVSWRFLQDLRALADDKGILLLLDEVQTGMGRNGRAVRP